MAATCDLIAATLQVLLLRVHSYMRNERIRRTGSIRTSTQPIVLQPPPVLLPIIDLLQYERFCHRVLAEFERIVGALRRAGMPTKIHFEAMAGSGEEFLKLVTETKPKPAGGEARIRIDNRYVRYSSHADPTS